MSLIEEIGELSLVCAGQKARIEELEELVREFSTVVEQGFHLAFPPDEQNWLKRVEQVQARAKALLEEGKPR